MAKKLFGEVALELGFVTTDKLYRALTVQAKDEADEKSYRSLGAILIEQGYMTEKQVLEVLKVLHSILPGTLPDTLPGGQKPGPTDPNGRKSGRVMEKNP